jgi:glycosyltransferase involved in cell wall biosynthesis
VLSHGRPTVTTAGFLTEPIWEESGAVVLTPAGDAEAMAQAAADLLADAPRRQEIGRRAAALYARRFDISHTIAALRSEVRAA